MTCALPVLNGIRLRTYTQNRTRAWVRNRCLWFVVALAVGIIPLPAHPQSVDRVAGGPLANVAYRTVPEARKDSILVALEQKLLDAIAIGDTALWSKYLDGEFLITAEDGSTQTRNEFLASMRPLPKGYSGTIKITNPRVIFRSDVCVLNYTADEFEWVYGQQLHTQYSSISVYQKSGSSWILFRSQIFEIPQLPPAGMVPGTVLKHYVGTYQLTEGIVYTVSLEGGRLYGQRTGRTKEELIPETEAVFFRKSDTRGRKLFIPDKDGRIQMIERRYASDVVWKKLDASEIIK